MSDSPKTRASLILRLRHADDQRAWEEFVEIYQPLVFRLARTKGLQEADALDLTQEVMTKVAHAINHFDPDPEQGSFRGWISRITRNLVIDFLRSQNRRQLAAGDTTVQQILESTPTLQDSQWFDLEHERQMFAWAAEKIRPTFQPKTWEAFWQTTVEQKPVAEVAGLLDLTSGAIYIAKSRVMAKLREKVQAHMNQDGVSSFRSGDQS